MRRVANAQKDTDKGRKPVAGARRTKDKAKKHAPGKTHRASDSPTEKDAAEHTLQLIEQHLAAIWQGLQRDGREWLTVEEVAEELQVSRDTVKRLMKSGSLKSAQIKTTNGRGMRHLCRVRREWVDEYLLSQVKPAPTNRRRRRWPKPEVDFIG